MSEKERIIQGNLLSKSTVCATYQWHPEGHAPSFRKQQVPSSTPGAHLMSRLLARLVNQQDRDSALQWSGTQPGARHQHLTSHTVQLLHETENARCKCNI